MRATPATVLLAALLACTAAAVAAAGPRKPLGKNGKQPNIVLLLTGEAGSTAAVGGASAGAERRTCMPVCHALVAPAVSDRLPLCPFAPCRRPGCGDGR